MKMFCRLLTVTMACFITTVAMAEPTNLQTNKDQLKQYVASGQYEKEQQQVINQAHSYLAKYIAYNASAQNPKKLAVVFDIDETSLSNYPDMVQLSFGGTIDELNKRINLGKDPVIAPSLQLYNYAKQNSVAVFFITGRPGWTMPATVRNLHNAGYKNWDGLVLRNKSSMKLPAETYKSAVRKKLEDQGYVIVANIGDQESDLIGGYAEKGFKLPNPFYYIP